jgi:hypothetical protein
MLMKVEEYFQREREREREREKLYVLCASDGLGVVLLEVHFLVGITTERPY